ncbi:MAG TPA: transglycosylase SLT domain-containing protein [Bradyrhizobium sp.]|nr:transglycosylase SLT domain-containing protein [Bradyrhizobium sp.]
MTPSLFPSQSIQAQSIQAGGQTIQPEVLASIQQASANTGMDFSYLMAQASRESSFDPTAKAATSSASGLYQFVEQTWLGEFQQHGAEYGYGDLASQIVKHSDGHYSVSNPTVRKQILDLRKDPSMNAAMAAELAADNKTKMEKTLGRSVSSTDLYLAHFLGLSGALHFIRTMESSPNTTGAAMFPRAAAANNSVFYTKAGRALTVSEIYGKIEANMTSSQAAFASLSTTPTGTAVASASAPSSAVAGASGTLQGFSNPGSILSPLMLVTLAALPSAPEAEQQTQSQAISPKHGAIHTSSHLGRTINPMAALGLG